MLLSLAKVFLLATTPTVLQISLIVSCLACRILSCPALSCLV
jgi:hypothetical protein